MPHYPFSWAPFSLAFHLLLYLLPGLALCCLVRRAPALFTLVAAGALLGYASFWIFFWSKPGGKAFSLLVTAASLAIVIRHRRRALSLLTRHRTPLLLVLLAGVLHLSLFYLTGPPVATLEPGLANTRWTAADLPGDNLIPYLFANRIYAHEPLRPFCCGDWLSSDRPPLQAGIVLFLRPLRLLEPLGRQYQILGTMLQEFWILGVWSFLRRYRFPARLVLAGLQLLIVSQFVFFNSLYVWPKFLAAALIFFTASLLLRRSLTLAGLAFGLALLAHPGSVFSLPALLLFCTRGPVRWKPALGGLVVGLALAVPWLLYQRYVDPPGNRLTKMHLAGVDTVDQRGLLQTLHDQYGKLSPTQIVSYKAGNLRTVVGPEPWQWFSPPASVRHLSNALGILNLAWLAVVFSRPGRRLLLLAATNLVVWCLVMFGPVGTLLAHASFADVLLVELALAIALVAALRRWSLLLLTAQWLALALRWVPWTGPVHWVALLDALAATGVLVYWFTRLPLARAATLHTAHEPHRAQ